MKNDLVFYEKLKVKRKELDLTIEDISDSIKIETKFIRALEEGDFEILPNTYIRLFLKTYAEELDLDVDNILEEYDKFSEKHGLASNSKSKDFESTDQGSKLNIKPPNKKKSISAIIITILILIFVIYSLKKIFNNGEKQNTGPGAIDSTKLPLEEPSEDTLSKTTSNDSVNISDTTNKVPEKTSEDKIDSEEDIVEQDTETTTEEDTSKVEEKFVDNLEIEDKKLDLETYFQDTCWVRIIVDESDTMEAIYYNNNRGNWQGKENFKVEIGNPGGISSMSLNGRSLGSIGDNDIPVILRINREGIYNKSILE